VFCVFPKEKGRRARKRTVLDNPKNRNTQTARSKIHGKPDLRPEKHKVTIGPHQGDPPTQEIKNASEPKKFSA